MNYFNHLSSFPFVAPLLITACVRRALEKKKRFPARINHANRGTAKFDFRHSLS